MAISPEKWEIVKTLFESAQDLPAEQVPAFLATSLPTLRCGRKLAAFSPSSMRPRLFSPLQP